MSAAERVLDALIAITSSPRAMTAAELAQQLDVPVSSVYRHIALLKQYDLVADMGRDGGFAPGPACWRIGQSFDGLQLISAIARPVMVALSETTQESVGLMQAVATDVVCVEMVESSQSLRCSFAKGRSQPLRAGASAKLLLAYQPEVVRRLVQQGALRRDALEALEAELASIRAQGHAQSESEVDMGVWGVSAPVFDSAGRLVCGLSLMAPVVRVGTRTQEFVAATVKAAADITRRLAESIDNQNQNGNSQ